MPVVLGLRGAVRVVLVSLNFREAFLFRVSVFSVLTTR